MMGLKLQETLKQLLLYHRDPHEGADGKRRKIYWNCLAEYKTLNSTTPTGDSNTGSMYVIHLTFVLDFLMILFLSLCNRNV